MSRGLPPAPLRVSASGRDASDAAFLPIPWQHHLLIMFKDRKIRLLAAGSAAVGLIVLLTMVLLLAGGETHAPGTEERTAEQRQVNVSFRINDRLNPFILAPDPIQALALVIVRNTRLTSDIYESLTPDMINRIYRAAPDAPGDTILALAMRNFKMDAARALIRSGAKVDIDGARIAFEAINPEDRDRDLDAPFPDYSAGLPFLLLYLDNGGDPNAAAADGTTLLEYAGPGTINNLGAGMLLLEYGADPFLEPTGRDGTRHDSFFVGNSRLFPIPLEYMHRLTILGYFGEAPDAQLAKVLASYERDLKTIEALHQDGSAETTIFWIARQTILALRDHAGAKLTPYLAGFVARDIPEEAGWFLPASAYYTLAGEGAIHGPFGDRFWTDR